MSSTPSFGARLLSLFFGVTQSVFTALFTGLVDIALSLISPLLQSLFMSLGAP